MHPGRPTAIDQANAFVALAAAPGAGVPLVGGVAVFTDLWLSEVGVGYKLRVSASGLPTFTTGVINVVCIPFRRNTHDPRDTGPYS